MVVKIHNGYPHPVWEKDPNTRNEALDVRVYARAGAAIYGLDRFGDKQWEELEALIPNTPTRPKRKQLAILKPLKPTRIDDPWL